ncbi:uncharacterized protein LOC129089009 isoform X2 [Anoplopoma fimbria]|uniref:uncharacterized protein LOC129089009 isoform X2 n=1 Tax=Anoplopoma fimbria TaxID=229290 RepID=UPI0023ED27C6|nr:uncharacterized protein LOC129089009 isoform X2 [Anoplopoma fimbria]
MNRQNNSALNPSVLSKGGAPGSMQPPPGRIPQDFKAAMLQIPLKLSNNTNNSISDAAAQTQPAQKPAGKQDDSLDKSTDSSQRVEMYDPYDPLSSDSEHEMLRAQDHNKSPPDQDYKLGRQCSSPSTDLRKKRRWASCYSDSLGQPLHRQDSSPETRPTQSQGLSLGHRLHERQAYSLNTESLDRLGFTTISRHLDQMVCSPDMLIHASSAQQFPAFYGGQRTNGVERIIIPEYQREMNTTVRLSPPRLQQDYQQLKYLGTGQEQIPLSTEVPRKSNVDIIMDRSPITCDLCDVELANGQELEDHLESKSHWDTLEHIQQQNNYDDLAIAFIQEVMLYKSHQCSRAIEDGALEALQENDHMTKIEMFHCAACSVFVSTSVSSVHTHITSQEHYTNVKEFQVQQRRSCLDKAETMMKELKPQFEHFLKGGSPFE